MPSKSAGLFVVVHNPPSAASVRGFVAVLGRRQNAPSYAINIQVLHPEVAAWRCSGAGPKAPASADCPA